MLPAYTIENRALIIWTINATVVVVSMRFTGGQYQPLSEKQVIRVHEASCTILEDVGCSFEEQLRETADLLARAGARVDNDRRRITFPRDLVTEQAQKAPQRVLLCGREAQHDLELGGDRVHMGTGGAAIKILDLQSGEVRPSTLRDLYLLGRLVDRLENIHFFLRPCLPLDIPERDYDENIFYACFRATGKHVMGGVNDIEGFRKVLKMASLLAGGDPQLAARPFFSVITSFMISPLKLSTVPVGIMQEACRHRIPVALSSAPAAGSTSPITMAGTLVQLHAEELIGIAIAQLTNPGAPVLYGGIPGAANLRTMGYIGGAVECAMMNAAVHQLARYIGVPNYNSSGLTDSKVPDVQAGWEKAISSALTAMAGSNFVHHAAGMLESMLAVSYEQFVIDDEILGMCYRILDGIEVDGDQLALQAIAEVGAGGTYMMCDHTLKHMHTAFFEGNGVSDRSIRDVWQKEGGADARERARKIARSLIEGNQKVYMARKDDQALRKSYHILLNEDL
jgi:trimethylamine--corrinoid protein Co-methyltransferase